MRWYRVSKHGLQRCRRRHLTDGGRECPVTYSSPSAVSRARSPRQVRDAFLDGGLAGAFGLDFQEADGAVHIGPRADLVAAAPAVGGQQVAVQAGGVEVDGVVGEARASVHFQDPGFGAERGQDLAGRCRRNQILAVNPGLQRGFRGQFFQSHGGKLAQLRHDRFGVDAAHATPAEVGTDCRVCWRSRAVGTVAQLRGLGRQFLRRRGQRAGRLVEPSCECRGWDRSWWRGRTAYRTSTMVLSLTMSSSWMVAEWTLPWSTSSSRA